MNNMLIIVMPKKEVKPMDKENGKVMVPLYNIPMMSDERWNELSGRRRLEAKA